MKENVYLQLAEIDQQHWWHVARRRLVVQALTGLGLGQREKCLDVGCGPGGNFPLLSGLCSEGTGLDCSETALKLAGARFPQMRLVKGDANQVATLFPRERFDLVTVFNVLYHLWIKDEVAVLEQLCEIMNPDGILVVTEPAYEMLMRKHDAQAMGRRRYGMGEFREMLTRAGFRPVWGTYFNSMSLVPALLSALFERLRGGSEDSPEDEDVGELRIINAAINNAIIAAMGAESRLIKLFGSMPAGVTFLIVAIKT